MIPSTDRIECFPGRSLLHNPWFLPRPELLLVQVRCSNCLYRGAEEEEVEDIDEQEDGLVVDELWGGEEGGPLTGVGGAEEALVGAHVWQEHLLQGALRVHGGCEYHHQQRHSLCVAKITETQHCISVNRSFLYQKYSSRSRFFLLP